MEKQKKQNLLTTIIIILIIILVMLIGSIIYEEKINMSKQITQEVNGPVDSEDNENNIIQNDENNQEQPKEDENQAESEDYIGEEEKNTENSTDSEKSNEEKAIELVKQKWGNDDSVTFSVEQKNGTKYYVAVKSENQPTVWYEVDTETWEISEY